MFIFHKSLSEEQGKQKSEALLYVLFPEQRNKSQEVPAEHDWAKDFVKDHSRKDLLNIVQRYFIKRGSNFSKSVAYEIIKDWWEVHLEKGYLSNHEGVLLLKWAGAWEVEVDLLKSLLD
ncbi:MAG: hypothetical protein OXB93_05850 [Cytophagales bacterium]|nr:hypothetical protein [Cytophagales bacterium]